MADKVLVAGLGKVGRVLWRSLGRAGIATRTWQRGDVTGGPPVDVAILAVSDGAIGEVAAALLTGGAATASTILLHTAGSIDPLQAFRDVRGRVAGVGLMHPMRAFSDDRSDLQGASFGLAGDAPAVAAAQALVEKIGGFALRIPYASLARYHAAAVLASNHTLALLDAAIRLLVDEGVERSAAERAIGSLVASAAENVAARGLPAALTGPIARGDVAAVRRHLQVLASDESALRLYRQTGLATVQLARGRNDADRAALDAIARLLEQD